MLVFRVGKFYLVVWLVEFLYAEFGVDWIGDCGRLLVFAYFGLRFLV